MHPGYTSDLTQPFAPKLIQFAIAKIAENDRSDAVPVFDVNGSYVGYLAVPVFYAQAQVGQAQVAQAVAGAPAGGSAMILGMDATAFFALAGTMGVLAGVGGAAAAGAFKSDRAATPTGPNR